MKFMHAMKKWQGIYDVRTVTLARGRLASVAIEKNPPVQTAPRRGKHQAIRVGFVGLADCAPLVMARELAAALVKLNLISTAA